MTVFFIILLLPAAVRRELCILVQLLRDAGREAAFVLVSQGQVHCS